MLLETSFLYNNNQVGIESSSNIEEFPAENLLDPNKKLVWLSEDTFPQYIKFDLMTKFPFPLIGFFCCFCIDLCKVTNKMIILICFL